MKFDNLTKMSNCVVQNVFENVRIESVDDPVVNNTLFSLYSHLIAPLENIECTRREIETKQDKILDINLILSNSFRRTMGTNIPLGILYILSLILVAFWNESSPYLVLASKYCVLCDNILGYLEAFGIGRLLGVIAYIVLLFGGFYLFPLPISIALVCIKNMFYRIKISKIKNDIDDLEKEINNKVDAISDVVMFVPPSYRFSGALSYFVDSYANSRVNNLKEAVNSFDTFKHRMNVEKGLFNIENALRSIEYQQYIQNENIEYIRKRIW